MRSNNEKRALVVKIGGSLHASSNLARWIAALERCPHPLVIVSGGGPFADAVQAAQKTMGFSDATGHAMAVLAMEQYALALAGLYDLGLAGSLDEIAALHACGRIALWRPSSMVASAQDVAPGWDVTSDSLAAWLAQKLGAKTLLLIKSVDVAPGAFLDEIIAADVVDAAFADYVGQAQLHVAGPSALADAEAILAGGGVPGVRIIPDKQKIAS
jgi:dihydroneopterin aldolase